MLKHKFETFCITERFLPVVQEISNMKSVSRIMGQQHWCPSFHRQATEYNKDSDDGNTFLMGCHAGKS